MTTKIRYRFEGSSAQLKDKLRHMDRLGEIRSIKGIRTQTIRDKGTPDSRIVTLEKIVVTGKIGTASFTGVCWGYGGTGPHATLDILKTLGIPDDLATKAAFKSPRNELPGTDWQIVYHPGIWIYTEFKEHSTVFKQ